MLPWPVWVLIGVVLIAVGVVIHVSPATYGGPIVLGVIALVVGFNRFRDDRRIDSTGSDRTVE